MGTQMSIVWDREDPNRGIFGKWKVEVRKGEGWFFSFDLPRLLDGVAIGKDFHLRTSAKAAAERFAVKYLSPGD